MRSTTTDHLCACVARRCTVAPKADGDTSASWELFVPPPHQGPPTHLSMTCMILSSGAMSPSMENTPSVTTSCSVSAESVS